MCSSSTVLHGLGPTPPLSSEDTSMIPLSLGPLCLAPCGLWGAAGCPAIRCAGGEGKVWWCLITGPIAACPCMILLPGMMVPDCGAYSRLPSLNTADRNDGARTRPCEFALPISIPCIPSTSPAPCPLQSQHTVPLSVDGHNLPHVWVETPPICQTSWQSSDSSYGKLSKEAPT